MPLAASAGFERGGLGVGAVQHRQLRPRRLRGVRLPQLRRDTPGLVLLRLVRGDGRDRTARPHPDPGAAPRVAVAQHRLRRADDLGGGAVVAVEAQDRRAREMAGEVAQVARVSAPEPVDRLVRVTHREQVGAVAEPAVQQPQLRGADILELVDEEVPEPPPLPGRELGVLLERVTAPPEQIVEVGQAPPALLPLVARVDGGQLGRGAGRRPT